MDKNKFDNTSYPLDNRGISFINRTERISEKNGKYSKSFDSRISSFSDYTSEKVEEARKGKTLIIDNKENILAEKEN